MKEWCKLFKEESKDLLELDSKDIADLLRRHNSSKHSQRNVLWREQSILMTQFTTAG